MIGIKVPIIFDMGSFRGAARPNLAARTLKCVERKRPIVLASADQLHARVYIGPLALVLLSMLVP